MTDMHSGDPPPLGVFIVDDHPAVREGLRLLVSSEGMDVAGEAGGPDEALARLGACAPDLVVVDLSLDGEDGLVLVGELHERGVPVLVYSMHHDAQHVEGAFEAGALGYVTKAEFRGVLVDAIRAVAAGRRFVSPRAAHAMAEAMASEHTHALAALSPKERQVYRLVGQGEGTHGIAVAMGISTHTVESYCERIQQKLQLDGMHALRLHAVEHFHERS